MADIQKRASAVPLSSGIYRLVPADIDAVAGLFRRVFPSGNAPPDGLIRAISDLYLTPAEACGRVSSLVSYGENGVLNGFIGACPMPFVVNNKEHLAALCGGHMIDTCNADGFLGPRLLRTLLNGEQDLSIGDTANAISDAMWRRAKAHVLPDYSLEWVRVFRPASFLAQVAGRRKPRVLRYLGHSIMTCSLDGFSKRLLPSLGEVEPSQCVEEDVMDDEEFADFLKQFTSHFSARPNWNNMQLSDMVVQARHKPDFGDLSRRVVLQAGKTIGVYHMHTKPGGIGQVLQIAALPGAERLVVDRLFKTAREWDLAGVQGKTQPALLNAMMARKCLFANMSSTVVHAREAHLLEPFLRGQAFVNGFAGEGWTPFMGGGI